MKNTKAELKDNELEIVNGGTNVGGVCGPSYPTVKNNEYISSHPSPDTDTVGICRPAAETVVLRSMPKINPDEKYVMKTTPTADEIISELKS